MESEQIECADESSKEIKAIGKDTVHRICSGQVSNKSCKFNSIDFMGVLFP